MNSSKVTSNVYEILIIKNVYAKIPIMFFRHAGENYTNYLK